MTMARKRLLTIVIAVMMIATLGAIGSVFAVAVTTSDTINYPFVKGEDAFSNAPTWASKTENEDFWQFWRIYVSPAKLEDWDYIAIQIKTQGNPGFTVGAMMGNDSRFDIDGMNGYSTYFMSESGEISELSVIYGSINVGLNTSGMLLLPKTSLKWRFGPECTEIDSIYFTTNALYNYNFKLTVGEVGYYKGEPANGDYHALKTMPALNAEHSEYTADEKASHYINCGELEWPVYVAPPVQKPSEYPFAVGEEAFASAPVWISKTEKAVYWQFVRAYVPVTSLNNIDYLAIQLKTVQGNPGLTVGAMMGNDSRFDIDGMNGHPAYFMSESGAISELSVLYGSINIGFDAAGMLLLPKTSLKWRFGPECTEIDSIYFTTNAEYNYNFQLAIGEIGYFTGSPLNGGEYHALKTMPALNAEHPEYTNAEKANYYIDGEYFEWPKLVPTEEPFVMPETMEYPFATGKLAFKDATIWGGVTNKDNAEGRDNWQTFRVTFDKPADLSQATWLAVQYSAVTNAPGITYGLENGSARYSIVGHDGASTYMIKEDGSVKKSSVYQFDASNISSTGTLLIDLKEMGWQFGKDEDKDLTKISNLVLATNSKYNYSFDVMIGEVGYYTGTLGKEDCTFTKLVDLSKGAKLGQYKAVSDNAENCGTVRANVIDRLTYGDVTLNWLATGKTAESFDIWSGGSYGTVEIVKDSYGDDAAKLTCTGPNPNGDKYTATTIADGIHWNWAGRKGVVLWARNDSNIEVSFNLEMDVSNPAHSWTSAPANHNARHNIKQGGRFILYDVNTGKQTIYMTRPCVTLPVGFEGWIYVPFTDFYQADWSVNNGAMPRGMFIDENGAMATGSYVSYIAITVFSGDYTNKPFSVNKIGSYLTTPLFNSAFLGNGDKTIPALMELPALPGEDD